MIKGGGKVAPDISSVRDRCPQYCRAEPLIDRFIPRDHVGVGAGRRPSQLQQ
jgi:hypothetical protein